MGVFSGGIQVFEVSEPGEHGVGVTGAVCVVAQVAEDVAAEFVGRGRGVAECAGGGGAGGEEQIGAQEVGG